MGELIQLGGSGGTPSANNPDYYGGDIPFLSIADINGRDITNTAKTLTDEGLQNSAAWIVPSGAVSLAMYASVGKVGIIRQDTATSQAFYNMVFDNEALRDFVFTRLEKAETDSEWEPYISTGTQRNLNADKVKSFSLDVPSNEEASEISAYFANLDTLITLHQRECGKPPFNQSPAWEQRKLGELIQLGGSGGTPSANNPDYYGGDIPFLSIADINGRDITNTAKTLTDEGLQNSAAWIVPSGAVSLAMYASVGKVGIIRQDTATSQAFYNMVFDNEALRDFVFTRLEKAETDSEWEPYISTGTQRNLNADKVKSFSLDVPSNEEASEISAYFANLDTLITLHQRMCPIFSFCAHGSRTNFAQTLQGWLQILRYPRPIPKMLVSPSAPASGVFGTAKGAFICASSSAGASTSSPSARKNFITSSTLCCRESLSSP